MFGQYYHALTGHAPQQFRIKSLPSSNTEDEERSFNSLKTLSASSSNHHADNVLLNAFIRLQVKSDAMKETGLKKQERKNAISRHASVLTNEMETTIPFEVMQKQPDAYQAHLERFADFIMMGLWEETKDGIMLNDLKQTNKKFPALHHFRNSNMPMEYR